MTAHSPHISAGCIPVINKGNNMWTAIGNFFSAIAQALGLVRDRSKLKNSEAMQANAAAEDHQANVDEATDEVAAALKGDASALDELRKGVAK